ncbi:MAG: suppressor of fused domain protein, partial [Myxococcota bacterium]
VGIVSVPGPTPYTLLVTYGFSHVLSPSSFREGMQHEYSIALPAGTDPSPWADALLRHMARYVLSSGKDLIVGDVMPCHAPITCSAFQPEHHAMMPQTDLVGLVVGRDPALPSISTPHGAIEVRRFVGVDQLELDRAETWFGESFLEEYAKDEPLLLSALDRPSAMANAAFRERCAARAAREGSAQSAVMLGVSWRDTGDAFEIDIPGGREFHKLRDALRGRLPHGRTLMVVSRTSSPLLFQPGEGFGIEPTPQGLLIHGDLSHPQFQIFIGDVGGDSGASSRVARFRYA